MALRIQSDRETVDFWSPEDHKNYIETNKDPSCSLNVFKECRRGNVTFFYSAGIYSYKYVLGVINIII